ncbi:MAG: hypothetical protein NVS1B11_34560 [Terriglobales bacterium]
MQCPGTTQSCGVRLISSDLFPHQQVNKARPCGVHQQLWSAPKTWMAWNFIFLFGGDANMPFNFRKQRGERVPSPLLHGRYPQTEYLGSNPSAINHKTLICDPGAIVGSKE